MESRLKSYLPGGKFVSVSLERSRIMSSIRGKSNKSTERRLRMAFVRHGLSGWVLQTGDLPGKPDFFFPQARVAVFVDGCFWHCCRRCGHVPKTRSQFWQAKLERNRSRDSTTNRRLRQAGVRVLRFWEHDLQSVVKVTRAADLVAAAVKSTSGNAKRKRGRVIATVRRDKVINSHLSS